MGMSTIGIASDPSRCGNSFLQSDFKLYPEDEEGGIYCVPEDFEAQPEFATNAFMRPRVDSCSADIDRAREMSCGVGDAGSDCEGGDESVFDASNTAGWPAGPPRVHSAVASGAESASDDAINTHADLCDANTRFAGGMPSAMAAARKSVAACSTGVAPLEYTPSEENNPYAKPYRFQWRASAASTSRTRMSGRGAACTAPTMPAGPSSSPSSPASRTQSATPAAVLPRQQKPKSTSSKASSGASAGKQHRVCFYEQCPSPLQSNKWRIVTSGTTAGSRAWGSLVGKTLCDSCYSTFRKHGTLVRSVRTPEGWARLDGDGTVYRPNNPKGTGRKRQPQSDASAAAAAAKRRRSPQPTTSLPDEETSLGNDTSTMLGTIDESIGIPYNSDSASGSASSIQYFDDDTNSWDRDEETVTTQYASSIRHDLQ
jgi:hypothetical protein